MKKVVFLLLVVLLGGTHYVKAATTTTYSFDGYQMRLTYTSDEEGDRGYELEKIGSNPFSKMLMYDGCWLRITNVLEVDGNHFLYGYIHDEQKETFYDSFFLVLDSSGEIVKTQRLDYGEEEEIVYVGVLDNVIEVVSAQTVEDNQERLVFNTNYFTTYDFDFNEINHVTVSKECTSFGNTDYLLLCNQDYDSEYDYALTQDLEVISKDDSLPLDSEMVYHDQVYIPFLNRALLNHKEIENGVFLDYPGNYTLEYLGFSYHFTIEPSITGVADKMVYNHEITPTFSIGNAYLNDDLFVSGTTISAPGNYTLKVTGSNHYSDEIQFTISANVKGIVHNQVYTKPVDMTFNGQGYLNNAFITSPYTVSEPGDYILKVKGEQDYTETYFFTIEEPKDDTSFLHFIQQYDLIILGVVVVSGLLILKKK